MRMKKDKKSSALPYVSVVIPMRNEEGFISQCLDSIIANDYPKDRFEIVVVDGMSTDRSREIVKEYIDQHSDIRLLENPKRIRVTANNIGIRNARGEIIISMDAHVLYANDYIRNCVDLLQNTGAATVGTIQNAVGTNYLTRAIAVATTTPFGIGNAEFRYIKQEKWVDTFFLGAWHKKTLDKVGLFNEEWVRNGDYELNYRIRKAGGKVLVSPRLKCQYYVRNSLSKLARQYFLYGKWRVKTIVTHPGSIRWRHLLPPGLILWLLLSFVLLIFGVSIWWLPVAIYLLASFLAALTVSVRRGIIYFPLLLPIFWVLHSSWGVGFYFGMLSFGIPNVKVSTILQDILGKKKFD
jgi:glycosyltransferase involved in cell wall biosynthesis